MKTNEGIADRVLRMYLGMIIAGIGIMMNSAWAMIGIPVFLTGVMGICPLYSLFRLNTITRKEMHG